MQFPDKNEKSHLFIVFSLSALVSVIFPVIGLAYLLFGAISYRYIYEDALSKPREENNTYYLFSVATWPTWMTEWFKTFVSKKDNSEDKQIEKEEETEES